LSTHIFGIFFREKFGNDASDFKKVFRQCAKCPRLPLVVIKLRDNPVISFFIAPISLMKFKKMILLTEKM